MVAGQPRKLITHSARNGFLYTMDRANGQIVGAKPYMDVNWTKGIDQKTGKPIDYDPTKDIQTYAGVGNLTPGAPLKKVCPSQAGGNNYWPSSYSPNTKLLYIPAMTACVNISIDREKHNKAEGWNGGASARPTERFESNLTAVDPVTGEIKKSVHLRYPNYSGTLATAGGLVFLALLDGTVAALRRHHARRTVEDQCRLRLLRAADDLRGQRQAIYRDRVGRRARRPRRKLVNTPELKEQRNATVLYVFAL